MTLSSAKSRASALSRQDARAALARPEFYPDPVDRVDVRETHISWVFLAGDRAYKLISFYASYRAPVRAKVALLRAAQHVGGTG
jgi:aminoglycoside phosphotransferase family enzyme